VSVVAVLLLILAALVAVVVALAVSGVGGVYLDWAADTWTSFVSWIKGLFT
jgi:uncharacterized membrane-anchored protein